ncbi:MaoC/PaaZ C-terminal domain-containing protein [Fodinicurvata halophila]|uniref:MaoC/PaaZ C-terminal domain-containing protein n=1 Tax=Fodinicurvata halophila TaxID=1419723 RepID=A0ABV8UR82_9PROT
MTLDTQLPASSTVFTAERRFTQAEFDRFAEISGDDNPIHVDPVFSSQTRFGRTVAHGMLLYTALRGVIATHFPGMRQLTQSLMFPAPTFAEETLRLEVEVLDYPSAKECRLAMRILRAADATLTLEGETCIALDRETGA